MYRNISICIYYYRFILIYTYLYHSIISSVTLEVFERKGNELSATEILNKSPSYLKEKAVVNVHKVFKVINSYFLISFSSLVY